MKVLHCIAKECVNALLSTRLQLLNNFIMQIFISFSLLLRRWIEDMIPIAVAVMLLSSSTTAWKYEGKNLSFSVFTEQILISLGRGGIARALTCQQMNFQHFISSVDPVSCRIAVEFNFDSRKMLCKHRRQGEWWAFLGKMEFLELFISFSSEERKAYSCRETSEKAEWNSARVELTEGFRNVWQIPQYKRCRAALSFSFSGVVECY